MKFSNIKRRQNNRCSASAKVGVHNIGMRKVATLKILCFCDPSTTRFHLKTKY